MGPTGSRSGRWSRAPGGVPAPPAGEKIFQVRKYFRPYPRVNPRLPLVGEREGVCDVAVGVECGLADETVCRAVSG